jgi:DNA polymerase phi
LLGTLLQHYCVGDDEERLDSDALEVCPQSSYQNEESLVCYKACIDATSRMLLTETKNKKSQKAEAASAEASEEPVDVLVDTIIGFLEKSTSYMRTVGNQVFSLLTSSMKEGTIDLIITVSTSFVCRCYTFSCSRSNWKGVIHPNY